MRGRRLSVQGSILDGFQRGGFVPLAETPQLIAFGAFGRFWRPSGRVRRIEASDFRGFAAERRGGRTVITTETRVLATDDAARRSFK
ncbi:MAG: hypothetical protein ACRDSN_00090, partial [Pseudonocardiaceae bacterium]